MLSREIITASQSTKGAGHVGEKGSVLVIGSGAAGQGAARVLARSGWDVTVAESGKPGGTCLWNGCMPKKALSHAADIRRLIGDVEQYGLGACDPGYDWPGVLAWKWHAQETYAGDQERIMAGYGIRLVKESARFSSPDEVSVGDDLISPDHVVIATGSHTIMPPIPGIELADTSDDLLGYPSPPTSLLVVGGGFIGLEFAAIYAAFGTRVTVVTAADRVLEMLDPDTVAVAVRRLEHAGVEFKTGCRIESLSGSRTAITARVTEGELPAREFYADRVLMAVGRAPSLSGLDLDAAGVETDGHGHLVLDRFFRTTNPRVWAAGDAAGGMMQTPVASLEGKTVAESIDSGTPVAADCTVVPTTCFTDPPLAQVGMTEAAAARAGIAYRVALQRFDVLGTAIIDDERDGLVKLLFAVDDDRLLGAHIAGPNAAELAYAAAMALAHGATASTIRRVPGIHPAYSEALAWAAS